MSATSEANEIQTFETIWAYTCKEIPETNNIPRDKLPEFKRVCREKLTTYLNGELNQNIEKYKHYFYLPPSNTPNTSNTPNNVNLNNLALKENI
jgi:hypothetical protein